MIAAKRWNVVVTIDEHDGHTRAAACMHTRDGDLVGVGLARCNPAERDVPEIGDEIAVARAFADLSNHLLACAAADVGENTDERGVRRG
jgi:hypothetical protein